MRYKYLADNLGVVPVVALGLGSVAGLGAAQVSASHYSVMTKNTSAMFVAGPPVVARIGDKQALSKQALGGWEIQCGAGAVDDAVDTEEQAFERARRFLSYLPSSAYQVAARGPRTDPPGRREDWLFNADPARPLPALQDAPDHRSAGRSRHVLRDGPPFRPPGHHRSRPHRRPAGRDPRRRSVPRQRRVDGGCLQQGDPLRRSRRDVPRADRASRRLPRLHDRPRSRARRDHPARRARDGGDQPDHRAVVLDHHPQRVRRRRCRPCAGRPLRDALCVAVGMVGLAAAGRRHRSRLSRRDRRVRRSQGQARRDRGSPQRAALAVPHRRDLRRRRDHRSARHPPPALRFRQLSPSRC